MPNRLAFFLLLLTACSSGVKGGSHITHPTSCPAGTVPLPSPGPEGIQLTSQTGAVLSGSGASLPPKPLPPLQAQSPAEMELAAPLTVSVPDPRCPRLMHLVSPGIGIPMGSTVRSVEASWNGAPLVLVDQGKSEITETPHSYGEQLSFFKPVFSLEGQSPGQGKLEVRGYDGTHTLISTQTIDQLEVTAPPDLLTSCDVAAQAHPRIWLTADRLAKLQARAADDPAAQRFWSNKSGVGFFLDEYAKNSDPESTSFSNAVYDPESYLPALALCYQLTKDSDAVKAKSCSDAAHAMALKIAQDYNSGTRVFSRDDGYDIRFSLMYLMVTLDWLHDLLTSDERALFISVATKWVDWYQQNGYASTHPYENYYAGYLQGLTLTALVTAGESGDAQRLLDLLHSKLYWEAPILNQRICGGDWPEGWNYGPYSMQEMALVAQALRDAGEDWTADFDFVAATATSLTYQISPDFSELRSFGGYSGNLPHKTSPALLAVLSGTTPKGALAARLYKSVLAAPMNDAVDPTQAFTAYEMLYFTDATADVSSLPLSFLAPGTGRMFSLSAFGDPAAYQVTFENMSYLFDHYGYANGDVRLYHGPTCLVCPAAYRGPSFRGEDTTPAFSTYLLNGASQSTPRDNQRLFVVDADGLSAMGMRLDPSWAKDTYEEDQLSDGNALDYLIREAAHVKPGVLVVRDLVAHRSASAMLQALWHLGPSDAPQTLGGGAYKVGALNIATFGPRTTTFTKDTDSAGNTIGTLMQDDLTGDGELMTVFSDSATVTSWSGGVLKLSTGQCLTFASGTVSLGCP